MTPEPNHRWIRFSLRGLFLVLVVSSIIVFAVTRAASHFKETISDFRQRHTEVTESVRGVYAFARAQGKWPDSQDFETGLVPALPTDWNYEQNPQLGGPVLRLHGPYHTILSYRFFRDGGAPSRQWTLSVEGDKSQFQADVNYGELPGMSISPAKGSKLADIFGEGDLADVRLVYHDPNSPATTSVSLDQRGVAELFSNLTPEPNPLPWAIIATVEFRRNDRSREIQIFEITDEELGVRVDGRHYYRGLKMSTFMSYKPDE